MITSFSYQNNRLFCELVNLSEFAKTVETPFYLYSKNELIRNCRRVISAAKDVDLLPCYALKANYNLHILKLIKDAGFGADVVSGGELIFALKAGFDPKKIVFAGVGKTADEIDLAIHTGIHSLNIESMEELKNVSSIAKKNKKTVAVAVRINPDIEAQTHDYISTGLHRNKFGVSAIEALDMYKLIRDDPFLDADGLHVHIGSQITTSEPYKKTVKFLKDFAKTLESIGIRLSFIDLGGGIGINYENNFINPETLAVYTDTILPDYLAGFKGLGLKLVIELGRAIVGSAGLLITKVIYKKQTPVKKFLIVDAAMNNLIRPSLYSAYHEIVPLLLNDRDVEKIDVVGPVCESGDFLGKDRNIQGTEPGEFLAVVGAGAYGQVLASNYNLRPKIAEYLVDKKQTKVIFQQQKIESLLKDYD